MIGPHLIGPHLRGCHAGIFAVLIAAALCAAVQSPYAGSETESSEGLLAPVHDRLRAARAAVLDAHEDGVSRVRTLLASGDIAGAREALGAAPRGDLEVEALRTEIALKLHEFDEAREGLEILGEIAPESETTRRLRIEWTLAADDLEGLEKYCDRVLRADPSSTAALLGRGRLYVMLTRKESARHWFQQALSAAEDDWETVRALEGLADAHYDEQAYDSSLVYLERALSIPAADDRLLESLNLTLIRLGRVAEAIDAAELAIEINPYNEQAQYQLGNGYTRLNYSELEGAYPGAFPDAAEASALAAIDSVMASGERGRALTMLREMELQHGELTDLHVRMGSICFEEGRLEEALSHFQDAVRACPGNGRARNGIAKVLEAKHMRIGVHREGYEKAFADAPWPEVPGIEVFVINYNSLSDRHKKRVAMSIAPLASFIPVLVEAGATLYIKPLYKRLSSCPGLETLKDARINYDSRLWDDVRGCGGYSTVTGIEDVERNVLNGYNTVLHELSHQVHGVLTVEENREVQDLYRRAKSKHEAGTEVFVSRYQASSVWEYLAEGVNSYMTPRRDRYDPKQVVRERLEARDPGLLAFVERLISIREMEPYYAVGYANAGEDRLSRNQVDDAIAAFRRSLERDPDSPEGMRGLIQSLSVKGEDEAACEEAARALRIHPEAAQVVVAAVRAFYLRDGDARARMEELLRRRGSVDAAERYLIDLELGDAAFTAGEIDSSLRAFRRVLDYQSDNPEALWGAGYALSLVGDIGGARDYFERALMRRSGLVQLRCDYATVLIEAGDLDAAEDQLSEAALLDPESSSVEAVRGRLELERGAPAEAAAHLEEALERDPDNDVARTLLAKARLESGDPEGARKELEPLLERVESGAPPEYSYDAKRAAFSLVHTFPAHEKKLLYEVAAEASMKRSGD